MRGSVRSRKQESLQVDEHFILERITIGSIWNQASKHAANERISSLEFSTT
jgi:hypothetical protein